MAHADWIIDLAPGAATTAGGSCSEASGEAGETRRDAQHPLDDR
jgi:hypothetical protein